MTDFLTLQWNLSPEDKVAVNHLIDVSQIKGDDKDKVIEYLNNYLLSKEYQHEESNYAKILSPVLLSYNQDKNSFTGGNVKPNLLKIFRRNLLKKVL